MYKVPLNELEEIKKRLVESNSLLTDILRSRGFSVAQLIDAIDDNQRLIDSITIKYHISKD
jgi:hypothetical protein